MVVCEIEAHYNLHIPTLDWPRLRNRTAVQAYLQERLGVSE